MDFEMKSKENPRDVFLEHCVNKGNNFEVEPEEKKLKWTDLKFGDVIRNKYEDGYRSAMVGKFLLHFVLFI